MTHTIVITAGGTGGHLFPALSVGRALKDKGHSIIFMTDERGYHIEKTPADHTIVLPIRKTSGLFNLFLFGFSLLFSVFRCFFYFLKYKPSLVVGFGGYTSVPAVLTAQLMGIPTFIHEQNAVLGRANKLLAKRASAIGVAFKNVLKLDPNAKTSLTGNPVREHIKPLYDIDYETPSKKELLNIFVIGGSQGAKIFSTILPQSLSKLDPDQLNKISLSLQCRQEMLDETLKNLASFDIPKTIKPFFNDMGEQLKKAHLVISRSGASTLAELSLSGKPAILVPYAHAMDNHQYENAKQFQNHNAAWVIEQKNFNAEFLANLLKQIISQPTLLEEKSKNMRSLSFLNSELRLAQAIEDLLGK